METLTASTAFATSGLIVLLGLLVLMLAIRVATQATQITDLTRRIGKLELPATPAAKPLKEAAAGPEKARPMRLVR